MASSVCGDAPWFLVSPYERNIRWLSVGAGWWCGGRDPGVQQKPMSIFSSRSISYL